MFSALLEYALVNYASRSDAQRLAKKKHQKQWELDQLAFDPSDHMMGPNGPNGDGSNGGNGGSMDPMSGHNGSRMMGVGPPGAGPPPPPPLAPGAGGPGGPMGGVNNGGGMFPMVRYRKKYICYAVV